jgi:hypothetical protein
MFHWALPAVLERDERWGAATWRQRVLARLSILAGMTAAAGHLEALGAAAGAQESRRSAGRRPREAQPMLHN